MSGSLPQAQSIASVPPTPCCSPKNKLLCSLAGLTVLIVVALTAFTFGRNFIKPTSTTSQISPPVSFSVSPAPSPDPIAGWKVYEGETIFHTPGAPKFSIKYPSDWGELENLVLYPLGKIADKGLETRIYFGFGGRELPEPQIKKIFPAGEMDYFWKSDGSQIFAYATLTKDKNSYTFVIENLPASYEALYKELFNQILSTFQFLP